MPPTARCRRSGATGSPWNGVASLLAASRLSRVAPVSREMILNFVSSFSLGLPKSY